MWWKIYQVSAKVLVDGMNKTYDRVRSVGEISDWWERIQVNSMHLITLLSSATTTTAARTIT